MSVRGKFLSAQIKQHFTQIIHDVNMGTMSFLISVSARMCSASVIS